MSLLIDCLVPSGQPWNHLHANNETDSEVIFIYTSVHICTHTYVYVIILIKGKEAINSRVGGIGGRAWRKWYHYISIQNIFKNKTVGIRNQGAGGRWWPLTSNLHTLCTVHTYTHCTPRVHTKQAMGPPNHASVDATILDPSPWKHPV